MSPELLAALELMLVEACVSVLAELVVEEVFALSRPPVWVFHTGKCVHLLPAVGKWAVLVEASFIDVELAQISYMESLLDVLLRGRQVVVYWSREVSWLMDVALVSELWLEGGSSHSKPGKGIFLRAVRLSRKLVALEYRCVHVWLRWRRSKARCTHVDIAERMGAFLLYHAFSIERGTIVRHLLTVHLHRLFFL